MAFPQSFLDEVAAKNPIEDVVGQYVTLRRSGSVLFGRCPFHQEKTPPSPWPRIRVSTTASAAGRVAMW